jgi:hypothetical protein
MTSLNSGLADLAGLAHMNGCAVLDEVADFLARFITYPNEHARYAHTLWLAHTWRWTNGSPPHALRSCQPKRAAARRTHWK